MTTQDRNKSTVRRYYDEIWGRGALALVDELFTSGYRNLDPATPGGCVIGPAGFKALVTSYRDAMPDLRMEIVEQHADGDVVVSRWRASGTQRGAMMGIPATGRRVEGIEGVTITRFAGAAIDEDRVVWDLAGLLRGLGALPA